MLELIAKYVVINHKFGIAQQELEWLQTDRLKYHATDVTKDELDAETKMIELFHQRDRIIEELEACLKQ